MLQEYTNIIKLRKKYSGIDLGFEFVDSFLDFIKNYKSTSKEFSIIYDYNKNKEFQVNLSNVELYYQLNNFYQKFLTDYFVKNFEWCGRLYKVLYKFFYKNKNFSIAEEFVDLVSIKILNNLIQGFIIFQNIENKYNYAKYKDFLFNMISAYNLEDKKNSDAYELVEVILNLIITNNFIKLNIDFTFELSDFFINCAFHGISIQPPQIYPDDEFSIKFGGFYGVTNLADIIDYYRINNMIVYDPYFSNFNFKYRDKFLSDYYFVSTDEINYDDIFFDKSILRYLVIKKFILNDYCFQCLVAGMFGCYYFNKKTKNILMEKMYPGMNLNPQIIKIPNDLVKDYLG